METYIKEEYRLENGASVVNIFKYNMDNTWHWVVRGNKYHSHYGGSTLTDILIAHMDYVRYLKKSFDKSRYYDILTTNQVEEELFYLGL